MGLVILLAVVVLAGAVLSVQAAINGRLGETVGVLRSSLLTFAVRGGDRVVDSVFRAGAGGESA